MTALALEALRGYAHATRGEHFAWWCETHLRQSIDEWAGSPLALEEWQRDFMDEALAVDADEAPCWRSVALVVSRKNGKTALLAALALYTLLETDGSPEILLAASSDKQAGRLFDAVEAYARQNAEIADRVVVRAYIGEIARADGGGKILRMSSDPNRLHGYNPSLVIVDELHAWTTPSLRKAWAAFTTAGGARKRSQVFTITTAGEAQSRDLSILGRLIDGNEQRGEVERRSPGLTISRNAAAQTLVFNYCAPTRDPSDVAAMKLANPASWISTEYLERQAANPELSPSEVLQLHGCVWADAADAWIARATWDSVAVDGLVAPDGCDVWVGVDAANTEDCTAVAWAWRVDEERVGVACRVWAAKHGNAAHEMASGGVVDTRCVIPFIEELAERYSVREVVYDRNRFEVPAQMLSERGFDVADAWTQATNRSRAWTEWYGAVTNGRVAHDGDRVFAEHVCGAQARMTDFGWKVEKLRQRRAQKIDALVAAAMAAWRCRVAAVPVEPWVGAW